MHIPVLLGLAFLSAVLADVEITKPTAGGSYPATSVLTVTWKDSGDVPLLDDLTTTTIYLCTGTNDAINCFYPFVVGASLASLDGAYSATVSTAVAASGSFFLQMTSVIGAGGYVINYSDRFTLTGMAGTLVPTGEDETDAPSREYHPLSSVATTATPTTDSLGNTVTQSYTGVPSVITNSADVPYQYQSDWSTKYAPMQNQPGSTVTAVSMARKFPTSAVSFYFTTNTAKPAVQSTITMGWSYTPTSYINAASPQPMPSDDGGAYLSKSASASKKKRWDD